MDVDGIMNIGPYISEQLPQKPSKGGKSPSAIYLALADSEKFPVKLPKKLKHLGGGMMGTAYDIGGGKILKITTDKSEAKASSLIAGKKLPGVWKVFEVWKYKGQEMWIIYGEKLAPVSESKAEKAIEDALTAMFYADYERDPYNSLSYTNDILKEMLDACKTTWGKDLVRGLNALSNLGIRFSDLHTGNVMMRGSEMVIIDLGVSKSGQGKIGVAENIVADIEHAGHLIPLYKNPSKSEYAKLTQKHKLARGFLKGNDVFMWDSYYATHDEMIGKYNTTIKPIGKPTEFWAAGKAGGVGSIGLYLWSTSERDANKLETIAKRWFKDVYVSDIDTFSDEYF